MMYHSIPSFHGVQNPLQILGAPVSVRLVNGSVVRGDVFCYDTHGAKTVVLREQKDMPDGASHASFRIIEVQHVREVNSHGPPPPALDEWIPPCDPKVLEQRERASLAAFEAKKHTIGIGVTQEAQEIFNFIHKTHPDCRWTQDRSISVMGVMVNPPYGSDDCEGSGPALDRIKQVIHLYRQRRETDKHRIIPYNPQHINLPTPTGVPIGMDNGRFIEMDAGPPGDYPYLKVGPSGFNSTLTTTPPSPMGNQPPNSGYLMVVHQDEANMIQRGNTGMQPMISSSEHPGPFLAPHFIHGSNPTIHKSAGSISEGNNVVKSGMPLSDNDSSLRQDDSSVQTDPSIVGVRLLHDGPPILNHEKPPPPYSVASDPSTILRPHPNLDSAVDSHAAGSESIASGTGSWQLQSRNNSGGKNARSQRRGGGNRNRREA